MRGKNISAQMPYPETPPRFLVCVCVFALPVSGRTSLPCPSTPAPPPAAPAARGPGPCACRQRPCRAGASGTPRRGESPHPPTRRPHPPPPPRLRPSCPSWTHHRRSSERLLLRRRCSGRPRLQLGQRAPPRARRGRPPRQGRGWEHTHTQVMLMEETEVEDEDEVVKVLD